MDGTSEKNDKLPTFIQALTSEEKKLLKSSLASKVPFFFDENNHLRYTKEFTKEKFNYLAEALIKVSPNCEIIPSNGIVYKGFPDWVTDSLLSYLQIEAIGRRDKPLDRIDHFLGCGGKYADLISVQPEIISFVSQLIGKKVRPTGIASYLYYDKPGLGIRPHVDTDVFSVNMMLMLKHEYNQGFEPSATLVFPANSMMESYRLNVGEVMIMYGGAVIHSRSLINEYENVQLLTIGFNHDTQDVSL